MKTNEKHYVILTTDEITDYLSNSKLLKENETIVGLELLDGGLGVVIRNKS